jgi:hypothetical protein
VLNQALGALGQMVRQAKSENKESHAENFYSSYRQIPEDQANFKANPCALRRFYGMSLSWLVGILHKQWTVEILGC